MRATRMSPPVTQGLGVTATRPILVSAVTMEEAVCAAGEHRRTLQAFLSMVL